MTIVASTGTWPPFMAGVDASNTSRNPDDVSRFVRAGDVICATQSRIQGALRLVSSP